MNTRHLVDPELLPALESMLGPPLTAETLPAIRAWARMTPASPKSQVVVEERYIPGVPDAPDVRVLIYAPVAATPKAGYLHIHGGGYIFGAADESDAANKALAADTGSVVVSVDYRLAPETPHPGPIEDCYAALKWLHANAATLGIDPARIAIGGESAGGGLAAALAVLARDRGEVPIVFQRLFCPMIDDRTGSVGEPHPVAGEFGWTAAYNRFAWKSLLGREPGGPDTSPYAAAARAENLAGLPPAFISTSALDIFLDENLDYAKRLVRAGVPTELHVYPGGYHGFQIMTPEADVSRRANRDALDALKRALR